MTDFKRGLEDLIVIVAKEGASDLHLTVGRHPTIRVSGDLIPLVNKPVLTPEDAVGLVEQVLNVDNKKLFWQNKEIDFSYAAPNGVRFRGNAFFQRGFVGLALRLITGKIRTITDLNLPDKLTDFARRKQGFFLVVGPVGQGKSTTLAAMLDMINHERSEHIITIEDPVEYLFVGDKSIIDQREVRFDTHDFAHAMKAVFRQDVNVLMLGEMRGPETVATAVTAAETGHLVFSTLHTNSASQTIDRIIDAFPGNQQNQIRIQLAGSLLGIFSQRLLPRLSGGLVPAYELLINNNAVANLIREARTAEIDVVIETGLDEGMITLNHSLVELVRGGEISQETAYHHTLNPKGLERMI
ncbi:MAG: PilT/PilU family type 4a pilus ATPase [Patescibacteria group bacterium]|nr:PilT/PilU family type 4a pilus ATPase [Patescibacteria group bacterium]